MSSSPTENNSNSLNIRLKHPDQPKKEPIPPQSSTRIQHKFDNYELEKQQKLKKLRDEYEQKERESMVQCTKPFKINIKSSKQVKNHDRIDDYNNDEVIPNSRFRSYAESNKEYLFGNNEKVKKKIYTVDDSDLIKEKKFRDRIAQEVPEVWDEDGNLIDANNFRHSQTSPSQNDDNFYLDIPPSPKRVKPKGKYPSLAERALMTDKNKTSDSSFINSPSPSKSNSPYSTKTISSYSSKADSPYSTKSNFSRTTTSSFKDFEERQQRSHEKRVKQRKEAEQKIIEEANRSYTLPKSQELYKKRINRGDDPIRKKKNQDEEIAYTHIPDTSISRKRFKDQPLGSIVKPWEMNDNSQQEATATKKNVHNNYNSKLEKSFKVEDVEAQYITREVKLRSMEIEKECDKIMDCTFTPEKFSKYKIKSKPSSEGNPNKYIENADKQMARSRLSGQKIREEEEMAKIKESEDALFVHKKAKVPKTTKKLIDIVSKLKEEENDEKYNQKNDSLYNRSIEAMQRRNGKKIGSLYSPTKNSSDEYYNEDDNENQ